MLEKDRQGKNYNICDPSDDGFDKIKINQNVRKGQTRKEL
jgi:hypothetical protein